MHHHDDRFVGGVVFLGIKAVPTLAWKGVSTINPLLAAFVLAFGASVFELLNNRNFASSLSSCCATVALVAACWNRVMSGREKRLADRIEDLTSTVRTQGVIQNENRRHIAHLEAEVVKAQFDTAQVSAEFLAARGMIHSGERKRLGPAVVAGEVDVLVVEDDPQVQLAGARFLRHHGLIAETASTIGEAVALVHDRHQRGQHFHFVMLDIVLADGSGLELLDELRRLSLPTVAIVCTGRSDESVLADARERGAAKVLIKPVDPAELLSLLGANNHA